MLQEFVNVFCGSGDAILPRPGSLCAKWFFIKAQCGNNHPHASLPFSMVSAGAYSGAYPTGYGMNAPNYNGSPPKLHTALRISGFTHFHHSGTGAIEAYYNYMRTVPLIGGLASLNDLVAVTSEEGRPGFYGAQLENDIVAQLTVGEMRALHRYTFPKAGGEVAVDFAQCGLSKSLPPKFHAQPEQVQAKLLSNDSACGSMRLYGLTLFVHILCPGAQNSLFCAGKPVTARSFAVQDAQEPCGVLFAMGQQKRAQLYFGFSFHSAKQAKQNVRFDLGFDRSLVQAYSHWEEALARVEVETPDLQLKRTFYSMLYHSLLKPAKLEDPSPYNGSSSYYMDYSTLWDQYKTQLPLVLTLFPQRAAEMANSLLAFGERNGSLPCALILNGQTEFCDMQARALAVYFICSAWQQGISGINYRAALEILYRDIHAPRNEEFHKNGTATRNTHILDLADGCYYLAQLAESLGDKQKQKELDRLAAYWKNAYDASTGLLSEESDYYEGTAINYSFRLLHDMKGRAALFPSKEAYLTTLDRFFGFGEADAVQQLDPADRETMLRGMALGRFEGYNNEPDMETPYNYLFAGRHDRLCEVLTAAMGELFSSQREGLPGNNDSGGLSSCYVWNTLGIFPAFASGLFLLGRPFFRKAKICLEQGRSLIIWAKGLTEKTQYVQKVCFNGKKLEHPWLTVAQLQSGGELMFYMTENNPNKI